MYIFFKPVSESWCCPAGSGGDELQVAMCPRIQSKGRHYLRRSLFGGNFLAPKITTNRKVDNSSLFLRLWLVSLAASRVKGKTELSRMSSQAQLSYLG